MPDDVLKILKNDFHVSHETLEKLILYHDTLIKWESKINLIGPGTSHDIWNRHILDSIQLLKYIPDISACIADIGSGSGFPGMVLAIAGAKNIHLIESDGKKISFLQEISRLTRTLVHIHHSRIEDVLLPNIDIFVSRACSDLSVLLRYITNFVSHETICLFHKGKNYSKEIEDAKKDWSFDTEVFSSITDSHGVILKLSHIGRRQVNEPSHVT